MSEPKIELATYGGGARLEKSVMTISDYCRSVGNTKKASKTQAAWSEMADHLDKSGVGRVLLSSLSVQDCMTFRNYLTNSKLAQSTQSKHYGSFKSALRQAHLAYFIPVDLHDRLDSVSRGHATKEFLRQIEMDLLFSTPVRSQLTRKAFLFSCLTGMRHSDLKALKWANVYDMPDGTCELRYKMQKTGRAHVLPIGKQAREVMGNRGKSEAFVLPGTPSIQSVNYTIHLWCKRAGIAKPISFHCARHTFATLCLSAGVPLKVVSDYLGHSSITQTEVYARLLEDERDRYVGRVGLTVSEDPQPTALRPVK
ncbi:MAG: site-specific integrase [Desulfobulbaceae bacterium]|nr:site-specific integrase [Desulfobulbaceae bacterium]